MSISSSATRRARWVVLGALSVVTVACGGPPKLVDPPLKVTSHDLVGSVHVAVLANRDWSEIKEALKPSFEITSKDALSMAIPATQTYMDRAVRALAFGLGVDLGERSITSKKVVSLDGSSSSSQSSAGSTQTDGKTGTDIVVTAQGRAASAAQSGASAADSFTRTTVRNPGSVAGAKTQALMDPTKADFIDRTLGKVDATDIDPVMRYQVATAIYQEIQTINHYIDAAARRSGYRAEFVRLQVSLMPRSPRLPYDAYVNVSFFASCMVDSAAAPKPAAAPPASAASSPARCNPGDEITYDSGTNPLARSPVVVPLLVTDNIESTLASRNIENMRQVALGLAGVLDGVGIKTDFNSFDDRRQALLGRSLNSIMTVGRVTDNTLRVRLGAMSQGPSGLRMVPRTHDVSLVVLVPEGTRRVTIASKTEFVDPDTAEILPSRSGSTRERDDEMRVARKYPEYCLTTERGDLGDGFKLLSELAFIGDQDAFSAALSSIRAACKATGWPEPSDSVALAEHRWRKVTYVWSDMVSLIPGSRFNHTAFDIDPRKKEPEPKQAANVCPAAQTAVLRDDGTAGTITLPLGKEMSGGKLAPVLRIAGAGAACHGVALAALAAAVDSSGRVLGLSFPSMEALGIPASCMGSARLEIAGCTAPTGDAGASQRRADGATKASAPARASTTVQAVADAGAKAEASDASAPPASYPIAYVGPKQAPEKALGKGQSTLRATSTHVTVDEGGEASVSITIKRGGEKAVFLGLRGADVLELPNSGVLQLTDSGWAVVGNGTATVVLRNLHEGRPVRLFLLDGDANPVKGSTVELAVLGPAQRKLARTP